MGLHGLLQGYFYLMNRSLVTTILHVVSCGDGLQMYRVKGKGKIIPTP
jgi:hypothetical protein